MAFQTVTSDPQGNQYSAAYVRIDSVRLDKANHKADIAVSCYKDADAAHASKVPFASYGVHIEAAEYDGHFSVAALDARDPWAIGYDVIKYQLAELLRDAVAV